MPESTRAVTTGRPPARAAERRRSGIARGAARQPPCTTGALEHAGRIAARVTHHRPLPRSDQERAGDCDRAAGSARLFRSRAVRICRQASLSRLHQARNVRPAPCWAGRPLTPQQRARTRHPLAAKGQCHVGSRWSGWRGRARHHGRAREHLAVVSQVRRGLRVGAAAEEAEAR